MAASLLLDRVSVLLRPGDGGDGGSAQDQPQSQLQQQHLAHLLRHLRGHRLLQTENLSDLGGLIGISNSNLRSVKTRFEGVCLLALLVADSPTDTFQDQCISWLRAVQNIIQSQDPQTTIEVAVWALHDLLKYSSQLPELAREVAMNHIPTIVTSLLGLKLECQQSAMDGMKACMTFYPRACGSLRGKLAAYLLSKLDTASPNIQELACQCYVLLPGLGTGFAQGVKYAESWSQQLHCLLATLHGVLEQLYEEAETDPVRYEGPGVDLPLPELSDSDPFCVLHLRQRFSALTRCLSLLLSSDFPVPVKLPLQVILNLVCRVLNINTKSMSWVGEGPLKMLVLPAIHCDALELLSSLITVCRKHLLRFADVICRLFPQVLTTWGTPRDAAMPGQEKAYSSVRVKVYEVLEQWVKVCGASSGVLQGVYHHADVLLANLIADITPVADTTKLRAGKPPGDGAQQLHYGKHSNKKQKLMEPSDATAMAGHKKQDTAANGDVCLAALKVCSAVFLSCGSLLKEETHKKLHELVLPLLIRLQQGTSAASPYLRADCRRELYRLLLFLLLVPNSKWPPPLHCAVRMFSQGQNDGDTEVSSFCSEALVVCNCLIHPRAPSLQMPLNPASLIAAAFKPPAPDPQLPGRQPPVPTFHLPAPPARPHPDPLVGLTPQGRPASSSASAPALRLPPPLTPAPPAAENHAPGGEAEGAGEAVFGNGGHRPVFVRYDKEEPSDVEISLESDSDDSVMIVPEGLLPQRPPDPKQQQQQQKEEEEEDEDEMYEHHRDGMSEDGDEPPPELTVQVLDLDEAVPLALPAADDGLAQDRPPLSCSEPPLPPSAWQEEGGPAPMEGPPEGPPGVRQEERPAEAAEEEEQPAAPEEEQEQVTKSPGEPAEEGAPREGQEAGEARRPAVGAAPDGDKADDAAPEGRVEDKGSTPIAGEPEARTENRDAAEAVAGESATERKDEERDPAKKDEAEGQDDPTAAMLADFVDCPPDEEEEEMEVAAAEGPSTSS